MAERASPVAAPPGTRGVQAAAAGPVKLNPNPNGSGHTDRPCSAPEWHYTQTLGDDVEEDTTAGNPVVFPAHVAAAVAASMAVGEGIEGFPTVRALPPTPNNSGRDNGGSGGGTGVAVTTTNAVAQHVVVNAGVGGGFNPSGAGGRVVVGRTTGRPPQLRASSLTSLLGSQGQQSPGTAAAAAAAATTASAGMLRGLSPAVPASAAWPSPTAAVGASGQCELPLQTPPQQQGLSGPYYHTHHQEPLVLCAIGTSVRVSVSQEAPSRAASVIQESPGKPVAADSGGTGAGGGGGAGGATTTEARHISGWASSPRAPLPRKPALPPEARASSAAAARNAASVAATTATTVAGGSGVAADAPAATDVTVMATRRRPASLRAAASSYPRDVQRVRRAASADGSGTNVQASVEGVANPSRPCPVPNASSAATADQQEAGAVEEAARPSAKVKKKTSAVGSSGPGPGGVSRGGGGSGSGSSAAAKSAVGKKTSTNKGPASAGGSSTSSGKKGAKARKRGSSGTKAIRVQAPVGAEGSAVGDGMARPGIAEAKGEPAAETAARPAGLCGAVGLLMRRVPADLSIILEETGSGSGSMCAPEPGSCQSLSELPLQGALVNETSHHVAKVAAYSGSSGLPSPGAAAGAVLPGVLRDALVSAGAVQKEKGRRSVPRELDPKLFQLGRILGSGSFATVYLARQLDTGGKVVVKRLDRRAASRAAQSEAENEVAILTRAGSHPNLVEFRGWYCDPRDGVMCLVMGFCDGGTLAQLIKNPPAAEAARPPGGAGVEAAGAFGTIIGAGGPGGSTALDDGALEADALAAAALQRASYFPEDVVMFWFVQLLLALHHLHGRKIMHRDLKPDNIFLASNRRVIKLGDLGVAKQLEGTFELAITCLGTPYYMSPECLASRPYTYASDIWSLGCVLYEMAARRTAFEAMGLPQLMYKILRVAYDPLPPQFSRPFQHLVNSMLRADPDDRPTTQDLLSHPFVRRHLKRLLDISAYKATSSGTADYPSVMPPKVKPSEARSAVKKLERAKAGGKKRRGANAAGVVEDLPGGLRPFSTGGAAGAGAGGRLNSPRAAAGGGPVSGVSGGGGGGAGSGSGGAGARAKSVLQWDSGARYEARRQQQVEMRFRAREFEQRITREQVRQQRRERDPVVRAREAELEALRQELLARRERKQVQVAEQEILQERLTEPYLALEDELAAFRTRNKLRHTRPVPNPPGTEFTWLQPPALEGDESEGADRRYFQDGGDVDVDDGIAEEYDCSYIEGGEGEHYDDEEQYAIVRTHSSRRARDGGRDTAALGSPAPNSGDAAGGHAVDMQPDEGPRSSDPGKHHGERATESGELEGDIPPISDIGRELMDQALMDSLAEEERQRSSALLHGFSEWHEALTSLAGRELYATISSSGRAASMSKSVSLPSGRTVNTEEGAAIAAPVQVTVAEPPRTAETTAMSLSVTMSSENPDFGSAADGDFAIADHAAGMFADTTTVLLASIPEPGSADNMSEQERHPSSQTRQQSATRQYMQHEAQPSESSLKGQRRHNQQQQPQQMASRGSLPRGTSAQQHGTETAREAGAALADAESCVEDEAFEDLDAGDQVSAQSWGTAQLAALVSGAAEEEEISREAGAAPGMPVTAAGSLSLEAQSSPVDTTTLYPEADTALAMGAQPQMAPQNRLVHSLHPVELILQEPSDIKPSPAAPGEVAAIASEFVVGARQGDVDVVVEPHKTAVRDSMGLGHSLNLDPMAGDMSSSMICKDFHEAEQEQEEDGDFDDSSDDDDSEEEELDEVDEEEEEEEEEDEEEEEEEEESGFEEDSEEEEEEEEEEDLEDLQEGDKEGTVGEIQEDVRDSRDAGESDNGRSMADEGAEDLVTEMAWPELSLRDSSLEAEGPGVEVSTDIGDSVNGGSTATGGVHLRSPSVPPQMDVAPEVSLQGYPSLSQRQSASLRASLDSSAAGERRARQQHLQQRTRSARPSRGPPADHMTLARSFQDLEQELRAVWDEKDEGAMRRVVDRIWSLTLMQQGVEGEGDEVSDGNPSGTASTTTNGAAAHSNEVLPIGTAAAPASASASAPKQGAPSCCSSSLRTDTGTSSSLSFGAAVDGGISIAASLTTQSQPPLERLAEELGANLAAEATGDDLAPCRLGDNEVSEVSMSARAMDAVAGANPLPEPVKVVKPVEMGGSSTRSESPLQQPGLDISRFLQCPGELDAPRRFSSPPASPSHAATALLAPLPQPLSLSPPGGAEYSPDRLRPIHQSSHAHLVKGGPTGASLAIIRPPLEWSLPGEDVDPSSALAPASTLQPRRRMGPQDAGLMSMSVIGPSAVGMRGLAPLRTARPSSGNTTANASAGGGSEAAVEAEEGVVSLSPPRLPLQPQPLHPLQPAVQTTGTNSYVGNRVSLAPLRSDVWPRASSAGGLTASVSAPSALALGLFPVGPPPAPSGAELTLLESRQGSYTGPSSAQTSSPQRPSSQDGNMLPPVNPPNLYRRRQGPSPRGANSVGMLSVAVDSMGAAAEDATTSPPYGQSHHQMNGGYGQQFLSPHGQPQSTLPDSYDQAQLGGLGPLVMPYSGAPHLRSLSHRNFHVSPSAMGVATAHGCSGGGGGASTTQPGILQAQNGGCRHHSLTGICVGGPSSGAVSGLWGQGVVSGVLEGDTDISMADSSVLGRLPVVTRNASNSPLLPPLQGTGHSPGLPISKAGSAVASALTGAAAAGAGAQGMNAICTSSVGSPLMPGRWHPGCSSQPSSARVSRTPSYNNGASSSASIGGGLVYMGDDAGGGGGGGGGGEGYEDPWSAADMDEALQTGNGVHYNRWDDRIATTPSHGNSCPPLPPLHPSPAQMQSQGQVLAGPMGGGGVVRPLSPTRSTTTGASPLGQRDGQTASQPVVSAELGHLMANIRRWKIDRSRHRAGLGAGRLAMVAGAGVTPPQQNTVE